MNDLRPPPSEPPARGRSGWLAVALAGIVLIAGGLVLCLLPLGLLGPAIVVGGLFFMLLVGLHYLIWGFWIARVLRDDDHG